MNSESSVICSSKNRNAIKNIFSFKLGFIWLKWDLNVSWSVKEQFGDSTLFSIFDSLLLTLYSSTPITTTGIVVLNYKKISTSLFQLGLNPHNYT